MKKILICGLPGSGKSTLASALVSKLSGVSSVIWLNADALRVQYNDWDFSHAGRIRQSVRMRDTAVSHDNVDFVICDFVAPLAEMRDIFRADVTIWINTISASRYADTNAMFEPLVSYDIQVTEQDSVKWADLIYTQLTTL